MQLSIDQKLLTEKRKVTFPKNMILTKRDLEILEFIIDMKFSSVTEVFEKFFRMTYSDTPAKSEHWAKKRLLQLEQNKFLRSVKSFSESKKYYVSTLKAYSALTNVYPEKRFCRPLLELNQATFAHDKVVLQSRVFLESNLKITDWISDRKLRTFSDMSGGLSSAYVPDGIYQLPSGEKIAFELEIAVKARSRYLDKIKRYSKICRSESPLFTKVHYVCAKPIVQKILTEETGIYSSLYTIESFENFFSSNSNLTKENQNV